jgi:alkylresorcinol/alkylpyrone synthase
MKTWGEANHHWIRTAKELGEKAVDGRACRTRVWMEATWVRSFLFTVTGICSPSIDALLVNRMGLCSNIRRVPIFGLGCVAGRCRPFRAPPIM